MMWQVAPLSTSHLLLGSPTPIDWNFATRLISSTRLELEAATAEACGFPRTHTWSSDWFGWPNHSDSDLHLQALGLLPHHPLAHPHLHSHHHTLHPLPHHHNSSKLVSSSTASSFSSTTSTRLKFLVFVTLSFGIGRLGLWFRFGFLVWMLLPTIFCHMTFLATVAALLGFRTILS